MLRRLAATAGLALVAAGSAGAAAQGFPHFGAGCARADFRSGDATVRAERCGPASGPRAVIVLHGCGGFGTFDHTLAVDLPRFGIATLDVDLFARTPPPGTKGFCDESRRRLDGSVSDLGTDRGGCGPVAAHPLCARRRRRLVARRRGRDRDRRGSPPVRRPRGLLGVCPRRPRWRAPDSCRRRSSSTAATHDIVPPRNARELYAAATRDHVASALFVYPDGSHGWPGEQGVAGRRRAAGFLLRHLR